MTTPLEAYLTGVIFVAITDPAAPLPSNLHAFTTVDEAGLINGIIQIHDNVGNVRASIYIQEHPR